MSTILFTIDNADEIKADALGMMRNALASLKSPAARKAFIVRDIAASIDAKAKVLGLTEAAACMNIVASPNSNGIFSVELSEVAYIGKGDLESDAATLERWARNIIGRDVSPMCKRLGIAVEGFRAKQDRKPVKFDAAKTVQRLKANHSAAELRAIKALL
jgi:hypothetical protein